MNAIFPRRISGLLAILLAFAAPALAAPTSAPATRPASTQSATAPATRPMAKAQRIAILMRRSIELLEQKKYSEAQRVLAESLALDPEDATTLYNMACCQALLGNKDVAMGYLEKSAELGFTDFTHINRDEDLKSLRDLPRYKALAARKDELQEKFARKMGESLEKQLGKGYLTRVDTSDKLIFATNTDEITLQALKKSLIGQTRALRETLFDSSSDEYITILLPSAQDYAKMVRMNGVLGLYNDETRTLISIAMGQVMTHEFTHALHHADFRAAGQEHPIWLIEGLASMWETGTWQDGQFVPHQNERLAAVQMLAKAKRLPSLEKLFKMNQPQFMRSPTAGYGTSASVLLYLYENGLLKKYYETVKASYDEKAPDRGTIVALEKVMGKKLSSVEADWKAWMLAQTPPLVSTGKDGAYLGVRFGQDNDGLKIEEIVKDGPCAASELRNGDVIVSLDGAETWDHPAFIALLGERQPGDQISIKVRRGDKYLEFPVRLGKRPAEPDSGEPFLGAQFAEAEGGVLIAEVSADSAAAKAGLRPGDLLVRIGQAKVKDPRSLIKAIQTIKPGDTVPFTVSRDGKEQIIPVALGRRPADAPAAEPATRPASRPAATAPGR